MRTVLLLALVAVGGALAAFGVSLKNAWYGAPGAVLFLSAAVVWIMGPAKREPVERGGQLTRGRGNRPTHDPKDFVGWD